MQRGAPPASPEKVRLAGLALILGGRGLRLRRMRLLPQSARRKFPAVSTLMLSGVLRALDKRRVAVAEKSQTSRCRRRSR